MPIPCSKPLKSNPFKAYRDPQSGRWVTILPSDLDHSPQPPYTCYQLQVTDWLPALQTATPELSNVC
ncbi:hypothetical protein [Sphaerothrix gracilis]|uniref:hypothetical protein n=1 Tax=Sphaerothrix gracilis TaxID=3151835 RepID=UPI0031FD11D8